MIIVFSQSVQNKVLTGLSQLFVALLLKEYGKYEKALIINRTDCFLLVTIKSNQILKGRMNNFLLHSKLKSLKTFCHADPTICTV